MGDARAAMRPKYHPSASRRAAWPPLAVPRRWVPRQPRGTIESIVATPSKQRPATLDEALAQLKHDPKSPVQARVGELDVELRVIGEASQAKERGPYSSLLNSAGSAESLAPDVARNKHEHLAEIYAPKRNAR